MKAVPTTENILRAQRQGAATADELAYDLAGGSNKLSAVLCNLQKQGRVVSRPYHYTGDGCKPVGERRLYSLPEHAP